jgi:hypothetical protein
MDLKALRHLHSKLSRVDSRDRFSNYTSLSETESVSIIRVLLWLRTGLPKLYYSHKSGSPGKTLLEICDFIFLSEILSVYCEGIEPAAPRLT